MPANRSTWKSGRANSWWCIAYRTGVKCLWTAAYSRKSTWERWHDWYGDDAAAARARFKAVRILVTEVADA